MGERLDAFGGEHEYFGFFAEHLEAHLGSGGEQAEGEVGGVDGYFEAGGREETVVAGFGEAGKGYGFLGEEERVKGVAVERGRGVGEGVGGELQLTVGFAVECNAVFLRGFAVEQLCHLAVEHATVAVVVGVGVEEGEVVHLTGLAEGAVVVGLAVGVGAEHLVAVGEEVLTDIVVEVIALLQQGPIAFGAALQGLIVVEHIVAFGFATQGVEVVLEADRVETCGAVGGENGALHSLPMDGLVNVVLASQRQHEADEDQECGEWLHVLVTLLFLAGVVVEDGEGEGNGGEVFDDDGDFVVGADVGDGVEEVGVGLEGELAFDFLAATEEVYLIGLVGDEGDDDYLLRTGVLADGVVCCAFGGDAFFDHGIVDAALAAVVVVAAAVFDALLALVGLHDDGGESEGVGCGAAEFGGVVADVVEEGELRETGRGECVDGALVVGWGAVGELEGENDVDIAAQEWVGRGRMGEGGG